jgi:hypothetical protein
MIEFSLCFFLSRIDCVLVLTLATGGQLKYPIRFATLDAPPDDEITIESVGLNKISTIGFRLYSPTEYVINFLFMFNQLFLVHQWHIKHILHRIVIDHLV